MPRANGDDRDHSDADGWCRRGPSAEANCLKRLAVLNIVLPSSYSGARPIWSIFAALNSAISWIRSSYFEAGLGMIITVLTSVWVEAKALIHSSERRKSI